MGFFRHGGLVWAFVGFIEFVIRLLYIDFSFFFGWRSSSQDLVPSVHEFSQIVLWLNLVLHSIFAIFWALSNIEQKLRMNVFAPQKTSEKWTKWTSKSQWISSFSECLWKNCKTKIIPLFPSPSSPPQLWITKHMQNTKFGTPMKTTKANTNSKHFKHLFSLI